MAGAKSCCCCRRSGTAVLLLLFLTALHAATAYYVPGVYPVEWSAGSTAQVYVNSLTSFETEMPYDYYSLPFCRPPEGVRRIKESANLGTILEGLRIENSPYNLTVMTKELGKNACGPNGAAPPLDKAQAERLKKMVDRGYRVRMVLDNLPVTVYDLESDNEFVRPGFELGYKEGGRHFIHNHLRFNVLVHPSDGEYGNAARAGGGAAGGRRRLQQAGDAAAGAGGPYMIVGFEVQPCSVKRAPGKPIANVDCGPDADRPPEAQEIKEGEAVVYSYDVFWQLSATKWASRWDAYLRMPGGRVHWFSILNSLLIVLVMASLVALILIRTVRRDLAKYEALMVDAAEAADAKDESGWKLLAGDVFRPPPNARLLCVYVGSGAQVICTAAVTLVLATLGFLSPASRGALLSTAFGLYVLMSAVAGFAAVWLWGQASRSYDGWTAVALRVSLFYPGVLMLIFTVLNVAIKHTGSTGAVPARTYFGIAAVWFLVSAPLALAGGYLAASRAAVREPPTKTNQIPRQVPPPPLVAHPFLLFLSAGVLPFGTLFIELYFMMTSIWLGFFYYLFAFAFLVAVLTVAINIEISILCTYVQLCAEDHGWWWPAFRRGGCVALYVFAYNVAFLFTTLKSVSGFLPVLVYLAYTSIFASGLYFAMGAVGFAASGVFVVAIMRAVKSE